MRSFLKHSFIVCKKVVFILYFILFSVALMAQMNENTISTRGKSLGYACVVLDDFWSGFSNQAALALQNKATAGLSYSNQFAISELNNLQAAGVVPLQNIGSFGANYSYFGSSLYNEQKLGLAYARNFGKYIAGGLQFDYLSSHFGQGNYDSENLFTFEIGMLFKITQKLTTAFHVYNPISIKRNSYQNEHVDAILRAGLLYAFLPELNSILEFEKNVELPERVKLGFEYILLKNYSFRVGIASNPTIYTFGVGWQNLKWIFDIGVEVHNVLGVSPALSTAFKF